MRRWWLGGGGWVVMTVVGLCHGWDCAEETAPGATASVSSWVQKVFNDSLADLLLDQHRASLERSRESAELIHRRLEAACPEPERSCKWCWSLRDTGGLTGFHYQREAHYCPHLPDLPDLANPDDVTSLLRLCNSKAARCSFHNCVPFTDHRLVEQHRKDLGLPTRHNPLRLRLSPLELCCRTASEAHCEAPFFTQQIVLLGFLGAAGGLALVALAVVVGMAVKQGWISSEVLWLPDWLEGLTSLLGDGNRDMDEVALYNWARHRQPDPRERTRSQGRLERTLRECFNEHHAELNRFPDWIKEDVQCFNVFDWPNMVRRRRVTRKVNLRLFLSFPQLAACGLGDVYCEDENNPEYETLAVINNSDRGKNAFEDRTQLNQTTLTIVTDGDFWNPAPVSEPDGRTQTSEGTASLIPTRQSSKVQVAEMHPAPDSPRGSKDTLSLLPPDVVKTLMEDENKTPFVINDSEVTSSYA